MTVELWSFSSTLGVEPAELRGMSVEARDGGVGRVVDVVDRIGGAHVVIDTGPWIFGKNVVLPAGVITAVDRQDACVFIDRAKDEVKNAPEHDPEDEAAHHEALTSHYGAAPEAAPAATTTPSLGSAEQLGGSVSSTIDLESDAGAGQAAEPASPPITGPAWSGRDERAGEAAGSDTPDTATSFREELETDTSSTQPDVAAVPREETATTDLQPTGGGAEAGARDEAPPARRFARDEDSDGAGEDKGTSRSTSSGRTQRGSTGDAPIARYDSLTAADVISRLPSLSQRELAEVERYEKRHESRRTVLARIESLREKEPWRGYDDDKVEDIRKKLADADDERAKRVRDYERRHRDRKGVMDAARRAVASA